MSAVAPRHIGFVAFCTTNIAIDIESLVNLLNGAYPVHRFLHTYVGATLAAVGMAVLLGLALRLRVLHSLATIFGSAGLRATPIIVGSLLGAWSHVLLDSIMHRDVAPWWPFSDGNDLLGSLSMVRLHLLCLAGFVIGLVVFIVRASYRHLKDRLQ